MTRMHHRASMLLIACVSGCASEPPPGVTQVTSQPHCKQLDKGVHLITYDELARLRGASLIEMDAPDGSDPLRLIAVSLGEQTAPGFRVVVNDIARSAPGELTVVVELEEPGWDQLRERATANPCIVLGFDDPAVERVRIESSGAPLGTIDLRSVGQ